MKKADLIKKLIAIKNNLRQNPNRSEWELDILIKEIKADGDKQLSLRE